MQAGIGWMKTGLMLEKGEIMEFSVSRDAVICEVIIKTDGGFEQWDLCSRRSRAMMLTRSGPPPLGWKPASCNGINRMLDVDLSKSAGKVVWPRSAGV